jgi:hypothetical protein
MSIIPENLLKLVSSADRKQFGRAGMTLPEHMAAYSDKQERELHNQVNGFLRRYEFNNFIHANPTRKSPLPPARILDDLREEAFTTRD